MAKKSFNHLPKIADAIKPAARQVVRNTAQEAVGHIQSQIRANGQIQTAFMLYSVYMVGDDFSSYSGGQNALPEIPRPASETEVDVAVAAYYAIYQNYLHQAFFEPGMERARADFNKALELINRRIREAAK
jgi:hypothetical protein